MEDLQLANLAIAGDENAFVQLLECYEQALYRIAFRILGNEHDALDAMQELSYRSFRYIRKVKEPQYVKTWLTRILLNICYDMASQKKREVIDDKLVHIVDESYEQYEMDINDYLKQLSEAQRELILLKYVEDRSNNQIADQLQIPEGTVKSRLHHTIKKLRTLFREEGAK